MDNRFRYQRSFIIFDEEDSGFGTEQRPSGHVKIEIRDGKGKLFCQVSNLTEDNGKVEYRLFLIKSDEHQVVPAFAGNIELKRNRGELEWSFDPHDINKTGIAFERFNVFAVLASYKDRQNNAPVCPLAAYKEGKVEWRQKLNKVLQEEKASEKMLNQNQKVDDIPNNVVDVKIESKKEESTIADNPIEKEQSEADNGGVSYNEDKLTETQQPAVVEENKLESLKDKEEDSEKPDEPSEENKESNEIEAMEEKPTGDQEKGKSYSSYDGSKIFDMYTVDNKNNTNLSANCINCIFFNNKNAEKVEIKEFGFEELSKQFDLTFERYAPFSAKRKDYNWWKVASPVHLNNILYKFGIKIPVLFNPLVLMAHYKYNHLIVGMYQDEIRQRDYIVCGIPGVYWVDEKPFGNACRWAQVEGNTPTYGAFGYWIVYINPKTGKILAVEE